LVLVVAVLGAPRYGQQATLRADSNPAAEEEVRKLELDLSRLLVKGDWGQYATYLADDYVRTNPDGKDQAREEVLAEFRSGQSTLVDMFPEDLKVRVYGDTALLAGNLTVVARQAGKVHESHVRCTKVFLRREGRWFLVSMHAAPIPR
jgi:ketosteroid isomerase-like protein